MDKSIQIVVFDNPNPPDYGGVVEVFYKIQTLYNLGVKVDLHFFAYGNRKDLGPLVGMCQNIFQYKRKMNINRLFSRLPFIVKSREHKQLLERLSKNKSPILFEGLHTCFYLNHPDLKNHYKIVRTHNIEHDYYTGLYKSSTNFLKKVFFRLEARKLKSFEPTLSYADLIISLTQSDTEYFGRYSKTLWLPPFSKSYFQRNVIGEYVLFHGNLAVEENSNAVLLLIENVFKSINHPVIIAGKSPDSSILKAVTKYDHIRLVSNPKQDQMDELIENAKIHVLYTDQNTGIKLKLVHSIQTSAHIIMNPDMLFDQTYADELEIPEDWETMIEVINSCAVSDKVKPRPRLRELFDNQKNAKVLLTYLNIADASNPQLQKNK